MSIHRFDSLGAAIGLLVCANLAFAGGESPINTKQTHSDPYPLNGAGWGPEDGNGLFVSRWAEDWRKRELSNMPMFNAMPIGGEASLTLSSEMRLRYDTYDNGQLKAGKDYQQGLFRLVLGADLRVNPHLRIYSEIATGQMDEPRTKAAANFQNDASLQQLFVDVHDYVGATLVGAMIGRQEYSDGPKQLISLGDGPNIHRVWNGTRAYVHGQNFRIGLFDLRATTLKKGVFDEKINNAEHIQGILISQFTTDDGGSGTYWDPFWIRSEKPNVRYGDQLGVDNRNTLGNRLRGRKNDFKFDLTLVHQSGSYNHRDVDAWGLFAVGSLALSNEGWRPKLNAHIDFASGGGAYGNGTIRDFNPLYASSNYLGEGQALSLSNLLMVAPGFSISPTPQINLAIEYGFAQRLNDDDAVYAGAMRTYSNTRNLSGHEIGGLFRVLGTWLVNKNLILSFNYEYLDAGDLLKRAALPSSTYAYVGATFRY